MSRLAHIAAALLALPALAEPPAPVKSYAQELVDREVSRNPGLLVIVMHVAVSSDSNYPIIASNIGRIGKPGDEDDLRVVNTKKTNLEVSHDGKRFEVELVLLDSAGETIGALGLVFPYKKSDDKAAFEKRAIRIRNRLSRRILDAKSLAETHPADPMATTKTHAQKMLEAAFAKHREVTALAVIAKHPKTGESAIVASSFGGIGKKTPPSPDEKHPIVDLPLFESGGTLYVGYAKGESRAAEKAAKLRDELRARLPSIEKLFELDP
jgi:iron complex outermembrane receptor protein